MRIGARFRRWVGIFGAMSVVVGTVVAVVDTVVAVVGTVTN